MKMKKIYSEPRYTSTDLRMEKGVLTGVTSDPSDGSGGLSNSWDNEKSTSSFEVDNEFGWRE